MIPFVASSGRVGENLGTDTGRCKGIRCGILNGSVFKLKRDVVVVFDTGVNLTIRPVVDHSGPVACFVFRGRKTTSDHP